MTKNSDVSKNRKALIFRASSQGALWTLLTLKHQGCAGRGNLPPPPPSEGTFRSTQAVNTDRLDCSLSVFENLSCLQDIWLRYNETKTSRNWEERREELISVSKKNEVLKTIIRFN